MSSSAVARWGDLDLLQAYFDHVEGLAINSSTKSARRRSAKKMLELHPDLNQWMKRPTPARLADLHRIKGWPFFVWCAIYQQLRVDAEFLLAKPGGVELSSVWDAAHPGDIDRASQAALLLGWSANWVRQVCRHELSVICVWAAKTVGELDDNDLANFASEIDRAVFLTESARHHAKTRLSAVGQVLYQLGHCATPARQWNSSPARSPGELATLIAQQAIRREVVRYAETISTVLRPTSVHTRVKAIRVFFDWLAGEHPEVQQLDQLERTLHIEPFIAWESNRPWRGPRGKDRTISRTQVHHDLVDLRVFFEDIAAWGWPTQPRHRLLFLADLPKMPESVPRALPPATDTNLMGAVRRLDDDFTRTGLIVLRATGMRVGELLDLELNCLIDFGAHGTWLRVPLGKLGTERTVPLEKDTLEVLDEWMAARGPQRALPHPRDGHMADFMFMKGGRRLSVWRLAKGLNDAAALAGITRPNGSPVHLTIHQLRHTFGTSLINAGISLPALMALMGHVTPDMTLRYARLASPVIRSSYEEAMVKVRARSSLPLLPLRARAVPTRVEWLSSEMLKTRVAHGYCSRDPVAGPCPYANICEQCDNYVPAPEFAHSLTSQLSDVTALREDAQERGWVGEVIRHDKVIASLQSHLGRIEKVKGI